MCSCGCYQLPKQIPGPIRARVQTARDIQNRRFSSDGSSDIICNADMRVGEIRQYCNLQEEGQSLMLVATSCCA